MAPIRTTLGQAAYNELRNDFKTLICGYLETDPTCTSKLGNTISPVGFPTQPGWKCLKVRWAPPGQGKSGGYRMAVAIHLDQGKVNVLQLWPRSSNPGNAQFAPAFTNPII